MSIIKMMANFLAKHSTITAHPGNQLIQKAIRRISRYGYWLLATLHSMLSLSEREQRKLYQCKVIVDTYPAMFRQPPVTSEEKYDGEIVDPANFCVRYATSYCAWKLKEFNGYWPTKPIQPKDAAHLAEINRRERKHDAKYWREFLEAQGYTQVTTPTNGHRYIGIKPDDGEYGLVVWFERYRGSSKINVSSYIDKDFRCWDANPDDFIWIEIN